MVWQADVVEPMRLCTTLTRLPRQKTEAATYQRTHLKITSSGKCSRFITLTTPGGNVLREIRSFFTGASGRFFIRRSYPISLSRQNPGREDVEGDGGAERRQERCEMREADFHAEGEVGV